MTKEDAEDVRRQVVGAAYDAKHDEAGKGRPGGMLYEFPNYAAEWHHYEANRRAIELAKGKR
jgi:hypothetical protein